MDLLRRHKSRVSAADGHQTVGLVQHIADLKAMFWDNVTYMKQIGLAK